MRLTTTLLLTVSLLTGALGYAHPEADLYERDLFRRAAEAEAYGYEEEEFLPVYRRYDSRCNACGGFSGKAYNMCYNSYCR